MKKIISVLLCVIILATLFSGCNNDTKAISDGEKTGETQTKTENEATSSSKPIELTLSIWGSDAYKETYDKLFAEYSKDHPNVKVEVLVIPFAEYQQKLAIMLAGGQEPDVAWISDRMIPQFLEENQLVDVSYLKDDADYDFDDINPSSFELLTKDGKPHGVAFSNPPIVLFYIKTMFEEKSLKTPTELAAEGNWTLDAFRETALALAEPDNGKYGVRLSNNWTDWMENTYFMSAGYGGEIFDDQNNFVYYSEESQKGIQLFMDMIFKDRSHPMPGDQVAFDSGNIGMFKSPVSYAGSAKNITDFEYDIAPLPKGPETSFVEAGFAGYVMFESEETDSEILEARKELYKFVTSKESMLETSAYFVPSRKSILSSEEYKNIIPLPNKDSIQTVIIDQIPNFQTYPSSIYWNEIDSEMQVIFDEMYTQAIDVKAAAEKMKSNVAPLALAS